MLHICTFTPLSVAARYWQLNVRICYSVWYLVILNITDTVTTIILRLTSAFIIIEPFILSNNPLPQNQIDDGPPLTVYVDNRYISLLTTISPLCVLIFIQRADLSFNHLLEGQMTSSRVTLENEFTQTKLVNAQAVTEDDIPPLT